MAKVLAKGRVEEFDGVTVVKISVARSAVPDVMAQLSCLRFAVADRLRVELASQVLELQLDEIIADEERATIRVQSARLSVGLSPTELDAWLAFLASCYWHKYPPADHVDLSVFDEEGKEYNIVLAVETPIEMSSPDEVRRALGLDKQ